MTTESNTDSSFNTLYVDTLDIGETLKQGRLEQHLDENDIAKALKIPLDQVRALESNHFSYFRSMTFARGFIKSYCRVLGIESADLLATFDAARKGTESTIQPVDKVNKQTHIGDPIVIVISVVIVAVLVFLVFWWPFQSSSADVSELEPNTANDITETIQEGDADLSLLTEADRFDESNDSTLGNDGSDQASNTVEVDPSNATERNSDEAVVTGLSAETMAILEEAGVNPSDVIRATANVPEPEPETPQTPMYSDDIMVTFSDDCWTEVRDGSGRILFSGVKTAGDDLTLTGKAPYRVVLGYADGVTSFKYKGEEFDFSSFTRKGLARFELK
ncbi:RodZ domain-containing protein [Marinomonas algarum]|uniref:DUF4115 domain-containing protein n=1 Tax=Marinomonas algarum TaxID=2883105 RepID=A0A9X1LF89_9GAMM|nr:RodZ domain-containing protein [Marinomonas algarum]MCB5162806.1 DUF4115 domain-containing protein [Marinomonas algarum]